MPELPEIETIKKGIANNIGAKIISIEVNRLDIIKLWEYELDILYGKRLTDVGRRGKYLILSTKTLNIVFHLGMSGKFYMLNEKEEVTEPHVHVIIYLNNGNKLIYQDTRRFGGVWLVRDLGTFFSHLGVEPLSPDFTANYLYDITRGRKIPIKTLLLNQRLIGGIGNIYADESLFAAGIRPDKKAGLLTMEEAQNLCLAIKKVLATSINERGTTFRDFRDGYNNIGNFQNQLKVYGRTNGNCFACGYKLTRQVIGGRSSHFCPHCQQ